MIVLRGGIRSPLYIAKAIPKDSLAPGAEALGVIYYKYRYW